MKTKNLDVYFCDHCKKHLFRKSSMTKHETFCKSNPENYKKCLDGCKYLQSIEHVVDFESFNNNDDGYVEKTVKVFKCIKYDKLMFPFSIERKKLNEKYVTYSDQEPMPKECEGFEHAATDIEVFDFNF